MLRPGVLLFLVWLTLTGISQCCSCLRAERPCENFRSDAIFVGRVIELTPTQRPPSQDKDFYSGGYSMRFAVDESFRGELGTEVTVATGNGGGDCGTPLPVGEEFLIFAYRSENGKLETGLCSGNQRLTENPASEQIVERYRLLAKRSGGTIFGKLVSVKPFWREDSIETTAAEAIAGIVVHADSETFHAVTRTASDGSYEFNELPIGNYTVLPKIASGLDYDREYFDGKTNIKDGGCSRVLFLLKPSTKIRGRLIPPPGVRLEATEVVAIPTHLKEVTEFSGQSTSSDEDGRFELWPLPPGDYYVGVNISSSPDDEAPFPPTYYPGVTNQNAAAIVHIAEGEAKELELPLPEVARPR